MKKEEDIVVTLALLIVTQTALNAGRVHSHDDTMMQLGPVKAMQGHSVSLWCKVKYDSERIMPVNWQSPPNFKTRTSDCHSFKTGKYIMSCSDTEDSFEFYNMTIMDVEWADMGAYRCVHAKIVGTVDLLVLVPVTEVILKKVVTSTAEDPLLVHKYITCSTNCAYPTPMISWFLNDQRFNGTAVVTELGCSKDMEGQKRTTSTVTVKDIYKDKERKEYVISCKAENVIGQPKISKAITITYEEGLGSTATSFDGTCKHEFAEVTCQPVENCCCKSMLEVSSSWVTGCCNIDPPTCCVNGSLKEGCPVNNTTHQPDSGGEGKTAAHGLLIIICVPVVGVIVAMVLFIPRN